MKYSIVLKFLAILLCACCLFAAVGSALGIFVLESCGLYSKTVEEVKTDTFLQDNWFTARAVLQEYVLGVHSNLPETVEQVYLQEHNHYGIPPESTWLYTIHTLDGEQVDARFDPVLAANAVQEETTLTVLYPVVLSYTIGRWETGEIIEHFPAKTEPNAPTESDESVPTEPEATTEPEVTTPATQGTLLSETQENTENQTLPEEAATTATMPEAARQEQTNETQPGETQTPTMPQQAVFPEAFFHIELPSENITFHNTEEWGYVQGEYEFRFTLGYRESAEYIVTMYWLPGSHQQEDHWAWDLVEIAYGYRYHMIALLAVSMLLFVAFLVYLCCAAGRKPRTAQIGAGGLNRIPLDLYAALIAVAVYALAVGIWELVRWHFDQIEPMWLMMLLVCAMGFMACLLVVALLFACAAQLKTPGGFWWRRSVTGMVLVLAWRLFTSCVREGAKGCRWLYRNLKPLLNKGFSLLCKLFMGIWSIFKAVVLGIFRFLGRMLRALWRGLRKFAQMLPLTWQWLLVTFVMVFLLLIGLSVRNVGALMICLGICLAIVMYGAHCFGILLDSTKRMSKGDLDTKVEDKLLLGSFEEYASYLNALADVAVEAARKQMKSERMKAELVTNVSHDIKTPLTSIINYVDLLQKAETQAETEEYLEVLSRQSQRLKKLIDDLMEMSKASTGNMVVDLAELDAAEAVNQALGEFGDKLESAQLHPVFNPPKEKVSMIADGRLVWRVLSNLLSNAVKYALPGTRLYIDLAVLEDKVLISLKNISREQLNVSSEELMERFVRGDESRNTEGSGLGLNIARSLMELQKGQLQLLVDGDLFKVTLVFPKA